MSRESTIPIRTLPGETSAELTVLPDGRRPSDLDIRRAFAIVSIFAILTLSLRLAVMIRVSGFYVETGLAMGGLLATLTVLGTLLFRPQVPLEKTTGAAIVAFSVYLYAGAIISILGAGPHVHLFIYLVWFFPLLAFGKLVKSSFTAYSNPLWPFAPLFILVGLSWRLVSIFNTELLIILVVYCLSYASFAVVLRATTRFKEAYYLERERVESLKAEARILESVPDCYILLDSELRVKYLNDAACTEFGVDRSTLADGATVDSVSTSFSSSMMAGLRAATVSASARTFEAQNEAQTRWYELRCIPRDNGLSVYCRNITEAIPTRNRLEDAYRRLSEQAELLDKAQDAIFVLDMNHNVLYWNKGAERLYGWKISVATGRPMEQVFQQCFREIRNGVAAALIHGEWSGELTQRHRDGRFLTVESRFTLVNSEGGKPSSILAINTDVTERKIAEGRIHHLAFFDTLTRLPNRMMLRERLEKALGPGDDSHGGERVSDLAAERGDTGALIFIDLDDFKTLNDTLDHETGDLLLMQVAKRLTACMGEEPSAFRLGGDEFVVVLTGLSQQPVRAAEEAQVVGDRLSAALREPYQLGSYEYDGTSSIGVALFHEGETTVDDLLKRAELAMYQAKAGGGNVLCFFNPEMERMVAHRASLKADLRRALQNREFQLYYQPQVDTYAAVTGAEALLRWRHSIHGMIPPSEFIPLAEEAGLILELGQWVLETACRQIADWSKRPETEGLTVSVNVSVRQFFDSNFVEMVTGVLLKSGINPRRLMLEITESSAMESVNDTVAKMMALKEYGVAFSLDDFGTGYSSLSHLKLLPLDQLKVDRSFVSDLLTDPKDASIASAIIKLGQNLDLAVIGEGVETEEQRRLLEKLGCVEYQGYLFSPALPQAQFDRYVESSLQMKRSGVA